MVLMDTCQNKYWRQMQEEVREGEGWREERSRQENERTMIFFNEGNGISTVFFSIQPSGKNKNNNREREMGGGGARGRADIHTHTHALHIHACRHTHTYTQRGGERGTERDRQPDRDRDRYNKKSQHACLCASCKCKRNRWTDTTDRQKIKGDGGRREVYIMRKVKMQQAKFNPTYLCLFSW